MDIPMKICSDCKEEKSLDYFSFDKTRDRYLSVCKPCTSIRTKKYRKSHPEKWKQYDKNHNQKYKEVLIKWKSKGCQKCGEKRYWVIDAHHLYNKDFSPGTAKRGIKILKEELKKCIPLCANCHRDLHYNLDN